MLASLGGVRAVVFLLLLPGSLLGSWLAAGRPRQGAVAACATVASVLISTALFTAARLWAPDPGPRLRLGLDPAPLAARQRIEAWYAAQGVDWPDDGSSRPYAEGGEGAPPLIADDADVAVIAAHLGRFAIDLLARPGATAFPYPAYVIGLSDRWLFDAPFDVRPIDLGEADAWGATREPGDRAALAALLADLTERTPDEG